MKAKQIDSIIKFLYQRNSFHHFFFLSKQPNTFSTKKKNKKQKINNNKRKFNFNGIIKIAHKCPHLIPECKEQNINPTKTPFKNQTSSTHITMPIAITHTPHSSISTFPPPFPNSSALRPNSFLKFHTSSSLSSGASTFFNKTLPFPNPNSGGFLRRRSPLRRASLRASATAATDYYSTLKVGRNATLQEIKASYRKLARKVCAFL